MTKYRSCDYCGNTHGNTYDFNTINGEKTVCSDCISKLVEIYEKYKLVQSFTLNDMFDKMMEKEKKDI